MTASRRSVVVLHEAFAADARPDELDALDQVREIGEALTRLRWRTVTQEVDLDLQATLQRLHRDQPSCVFNLVESLHGRGELIGVVPALLEVAALPYTGSDSNAINLSSQKILAKKWMRSQGIATPDWFAISEPGQGQQLFAAEDDETARWIVKSLWEHASFGIDDASVVTGRIAAERRIRHCAATLGGQWFAERFVDGREFNVSILEQEGQPYVLPIAEMTFVDFPEDKPRIVGYAAKWRESAAEYAATERRFGSLDRQQRAALAALARKCWATFGLRGYARVDLRLDEEGTPWVLEVNANPCLARDAGFCAAAAEAGIRYRQIIDMIMHAAIRPRLPILRRMAQSTRHRL